jgi:hypothetical protein
MQRVGWLCTLLGVWLICAPFFLGYSGASGAMWNDVITGICVVILGTWAALVFKKRVKREWLKADK